MSNNNADNGILLDARNAAEALSISPRKLWELSVKGDIPSVRIGRRRLYRPTDLDAFAAARLENASDHE